MRRTLLTAAVAVPLVHAAAVAGADERRAGFAVGARIVAGCTVATDAAGSWGQIDLGTVPGVTGQTATAGIAADGVSGLVVTCTPGTAATLRADLGQNAAGGQRRLRSGAAGSALPYALRVGDTAQPWGVQAYALTFLPGVARQTLPVSATVVLPAMTAAGLYTDTVRITLSF